MQQSTSILFKKSYSKFAVGAFNIFTMEQVRGLFKGANICGAPVIVAITPIARSYAHPTMLKEMINAASAIYPKVVFAVHLDHGNIGHCTDAIKSGNYNSVMIDASYETFEKNVKITSEIVKIAHFRGLDVEAELGILSGTEDGQSVEEENALYTNPSQALEFVKTSKCDSLAVAVGTSHGAYKFAGNSGLRLDILQKIQRVIPEFPLVLHGASAVPSNEVERINNAGGQLQASAQGIDPEELRQAIPLGVCKINIATDARLIWTRVHREFFIDQPEKIDPIIPGQEYINKYAEFVTAKCELLGAAEKCALFY